jgi:hypothetical protein
MLRRGRSLRPNVLAYSGLRTSTIKGKLIGLLLRESALDRFLVIGAEKATEVSSVVNVLWSAVRALWFLQVERAL